jgi:Integrase core domain/Integrase zinc binding domain
MAKKIEVASDHITRQWLLSLAEPRARLARWIVCNRGLDFVVRYAPGDGSLMVVPDALSRDTMSEEATLCARSLETVGLMDEENDETSVEERVGRVTVLDVATIREAQSKEFKDVGKWVDDDETLLIDVDSVLVKLGAAEGRVLTVVSKCLQRLVLGKIHCSQLHGHWSYSRSASRLAQRWWLATWKKDLRQYIINCTACEPQRWRRSGQRQAKIIKYHAKRQFDIVAADIVEISPKATRGELKAMVMGDMLSRLVLVVPIPDEKARTVTTVLLDRWILLFGPPERLLTDNGPNFASETSKYYAA